MSDVFRFHQTRSPLKASVRQAVALGISTHPDPPGAAEAVPLPLGATFVSPGALNQLNPIASGRMAEGATLQDTLRGAHAAGDLDGFVAAAGAYLEDRGALKLSDLHPVGQAAYALFDRMGARIERRPIDDFLARMDARDADLVDYLSGALADDLGRLNDTILALEALRLHGAERGFSQIQALKSLYGLAIAHDLRSRDRKTWSASPVQRVFDMRVYLPGWVWEIDPCKRAQLGDERARLMSDSPLVRRAEAVKASPSAAGHDDHACECACDNSCIPQDPCCAQARSFITDLLVVRETLQCYLPADISYIENVLAGEERSRKHSTLLQIEQNTETETTISASEERDHQVSERFELSSETEKTIESDAQLDAGVTVNQSWGTGDLTATTNVGLSTSSSTTDQAARNYARDVVDRSVTRIERNVRQLVSRSVLSKTREVNRHSFDRRGQDLTVGIYTWVSKTLKAQVFGYGRRMVYEFDLPEPAAQYRELMRRAFDLDATFTGGEPPAMPPTASEITPDNYLALTDAYGVDDAPAPPAANVTLTADLGNSYGGEHYNAWRMMWVFSGARQELASVSVPSGYQAASMSGSLTVNYNGHTSTANVVVHIGANDLAWSSGGQAPSGPVLLPGLEGQLQVIADCYNVTNFGVHVLVQCTPKPSLLSAWQGQVHSLLADAYAKRRQAYDEAKAAFDQSQADKQSAMDGFIRNQSPFAHRETERTQLKAMTISWLTCQFFDQFKAMKQRVQPCGLPQMNLHEAEAEAKIIRFWEQAIDWGLMTYLFYPYFWGRKCTWAERIAEDTGDALFDKFLQAGSARVQAPVAPGFEDYMLYWENTGQIWGQVGEPPVSSSDAHWVSMVEELKHQQDCYLDDREGHVDTAPPSPVVVVKGSDRYWDPVAGALDAAAIAADLDREVSIDGVVYRIVGIAADPGSPAYDPLHPDGMWWQLTLDRPYEGSAAQGLAYAVGAKYVGAPWIVTVPTDLIWLKNDTYCLPCYPVTCQGH